MSERKPILTGEQWNEIRPLIPPRPPRLKGGPPPDEHRACLEAILLIVKIGGEVDPSVESKDGLPGSEVVLDHRVRAELCSEKAQSGFFFAPI